MRKNLTKEKIKNGGTAFGCFCNLYSPTIVETLGLVGFDFVIMDAEHGPMGVSECEAMVRAADYTNITPIIRIAENVRQNILRYLDIGALGVQMPMINTKADAQEVVYAVKYPPVGLRGLAGVRANNYGLTGPLGDYVKVANEETLVITHVENLQAAANLDEMMSVAGIDIIFVGPTDLSSSMGYPGQMNHPEVQAMIEKLVRQIKAGGKAAGTIAHDFDSLKKAKERGFQYIAYGVVQALAKASRDYLASARS